MSNRERLSCNTFRKMGHPQNSEQCQGWEQTDVSDTLNIFDNSEQRTPVLVLENHPNDSRVKIKTDGIFQTLSSRMGTGGQRPDGTGKERHNGRNRQFGQHRYCRAKAYST